MSDLKAFKIGDRVVYSFMRIRQGVIVWASTESESVKIRWDEMLCNPKDRFDIRSTHSWLKQSNILLKPLI